ncbi:hypothetical protein PoB_000068800 [Plakobranchus ocellatus]|uniref:SEA domain-containing protein n=1 Tax=Plakobranchus ocellatus TaxID=259542 RepID=A0AAV3XW22_9GAST|nr:hypothetical protein PoB_000068800 [Plakobranchus ocellatus]
MDDLIKLPSDSSQALNNIRRVEVDMSLRILNVTYLSAMANNSSATFRLVAKPVCTEVNSFFVGSNYSADYLGCEVRLISDASLLVEFTLAFNGSHHLDRLRWHVYDIIEGGTTKHLVRERQLVYVLLGYFMVDIRTNWNLAFDGVEARLTFPVFNLNYSYTLQDQNSYDFRRIATPFCADVRSILTARIKSPFARRYHTCYVTNIRPGPDSISFHVQFVGREWRLLQKMLVYILFDGAREAIIQDQTMKMIGPLIITPYKVDFIIKPINVTSVIPSTPLSSTTTPTTTQRE